MKKHRSVILSDEESICTRAPAGRRQTVGRLFEKGMDISGWGRYPVIEAKVDLPQTPGSLVVSGKDSLVARGLGRSYGDSSLAAHVLDTRYLDHFLAFDEETGTVTCEAGVSLAEVLRVFVPRGWFLPVTPGTKFVTVGGAIASDVHGKNHHVDGCFSDHVHSFRLMLADGKTVTCSRDENAELFHATAGGMGLTGVILEATFGLKRINSAYIDEIVLKAANLDEVFGLFAEHQSATYSVAWIDCLSTGDSLGRSLLMVGEHADDGRLELSRKQGLPMPVDLPGPTLNRYTISAFNTLYYNRVQRRRTERTVHYEPFFYPLDGIHNWNRMYGKAGFTQYQFVIPPESGLEGMRDIIRRIAASGKGSFLAVLKAFGDANANHLSFPMRGYTLALDFRIEDGLFPLLDKLDAVVHDLGGRVYLSKDVRMSEATFKRGYARWKEFHDLRVRYGADRVFNSLQSARLGL